LRLDVASGWSVRLRPLYIEEKPHREWTVFCPDTYIIALEIDFHRLLANIFFKLLIPLREKCKIKLDRIFAKNCGKVGLF
jgi:hypothetical protein